MDVERYERLAEAYGADVERWPQAERASALAWRAQAPDTARRLLAEAEALDFALDAWRPPMVSAALRDRVLAGAPAARPVRRGLGFWLSGAGLAAAAVAGVIVGVAGSTAVVSDVRADDVLAATLPDDAGASLSPFTLSNGSAQERSA